MNARSTTPALPQLLTINQVAERLGISSRTIWTYIGGGYLATIRLGPKTVRIESSELERFVAAARIGEGRAV